MGHGSSRFVGTALVGFLLATAGFGLTVPKEGASGERAHVGLASRVLLAPATHVVADTEPLETARPFVDKARAEAFESFELRRAASDAEPYARAAASFQLVESDGRWWIAAAAWDRVP